MINTTKLFIRKKYDKTMVFFFNFKLKKFKKKFCEELEKLSLNSLNFNIYFMRFYRDRYDELIKFKIKKNKNFLNLLKIKAILLANLFLFCLNAFFNGILAIILSTKKKNSIKPSNAPILVDSFYGCSSLKKNDLPFANKKINPEKILHLIRSKEIHKNCKLDPSFSDERSLLFFNNKNKIFNIVNKVPFVLRFSQKVFLLKLLLKWFVNPLNISIILKFYVEYIIYASILDFYGTKIYVDPKPGADLDSIILSYAMVKKEGESISFQRSYLSKKEHSILIYGCETLVCWSDNMKKKTHQTNNVKKFVYFFPPFGNKYLDQKYVDTLQKKITRNKVISIFDTSFTSGVSLFSKDIYNSAINFIFNLALVEKDIFLILKLKNYLSMQNISNKNRDLIKKLIKEDRLIVEDQIYKSNNEIIFLSDLICSFNSLTVFAEGIYQHKKNLVFNNLSFESDLTKKINNIDDGSCINNVEDFKKFLKLRIDKDSKRIDFAKIKKLLFTEKNTIDETAISNYFIN